MTISINLKTQTKQVLLLSLSVLALAFSGNGVAYDPSIDSLPRPTLTNYPVNGHCQLNQQGFVDMPAYQTLQNIKYRRALLSYGMRYAGSSAATSDFRCADLGLIAALWQSAIGAPITGRLSQGDAAAFAHAVDSIGSAYAQASPAYQPQTQSRMSGADMEVEMYRRLAEGGDAKAQFRLGAVYEKRHNYQEAAKWYQLSANQGEPLGINALNGLKQKSNGSISQAESIGKNNPFQDFDLKRLASLPDQFPNFQPNVAFQYLVTVFRHKNKMILNLKNRMAAITIIHKPCLSSVQNTIIRQKFIDKSNRLKGGGFNLTSD